jgi:glutamine amidotransferase
MCRLLGIYGRVAFWQTIVMEFQKQAEWGNIPPTAKESGHKDGWGMAKSNEEKTSMVQVTRQMGSAYASSTYRNTVYSIANQPHIFLCHLRKAIPEVTIVPENIHPFFWHRWAFIHNGTVYDSETLPRNPSLKLTSQGSDSEYFFHYLLTRLWADTQRKDEMETIVEAVTSLKVKYTALNCLLSNGSDLFVLTSYKKHRDYYTLYYQELSSGVIICSEPLASNRLDPNQWRALSNRTLLKIHASPPVIEKTSFGSDDD